MKRLQMVLGILFLLGIFGKVSAQQFTANVSKVNLTPPLEMNYSLGGYGDRMSKPATGINDSIWVKSLVMKKRGQKFALVTLDLLGLPPNVKPQLIEKLGEGWSISNVMLLPSHTHASLDMTALNNLNNLNSPQIGIYQPELLEFVLNKIARSIHLADRDLQEVKVGTSMTRVENMNGNRRNDPDSDKDLTITRIDKLNGKTLAVLVNWTAHPTFLNESDMEVSGGWPGYIQSGLEQKIGHEAVAMYYNGAQGDQSAARPKGNTRYEQAKVYGDKIAAIAFELFKETKCKQVSDFEYVYERVELPERCVHPTFMETGGAEYGMNEEVVKIILGIMSPSSTHIGALRLSDLLIVGAPGELAAGLGLKIKGELKAKGIKYPVIGGLANEWISYILSPEQYNGKGGYEASVSFYGENLGPVIVGAMLVSGFQLID